MARCLAKIGQFVLIYYICLELSEAVIINFSSNMLETRALSTVPFQVFLASATAEAFFSDSILSRRLLTKNVNIRGNVDPQSLLN